MLLYNFIMTRFEIPKGYIWAELGLKPFGAG